MAKDEQPTLGGSISTTLLLLSDLMLASDNAKERNRLKTKHDKLAKQLQALIDKAVPLNTKEYRNSISELQEAIESLEKAKEDMSKVAQAIDAIAEAISWIAKLIKLFA
jgi:hypothetical protein